jgi:hypothetical protein
MHDASKAHADLSGPNDANGLPMQSNAQKAVQGKVTKSNAIVRPASLSIECLNQGNGILSH